MTVNAPYHTRFRPAHAVRSMRYLIFGAYLVEHLARRPGPATYNVVKTLPDALGHAGLGRQIEQLLIGFGVLHHGGGFSIHGQNQQPAPPRMGAAPDFRTTAKYLC
jgi:hypothetical protein